MKRNVEPFVATKLDNLECEEQQQQHKNTIIENECTIENECISAKQTPHKL